MKKDIDINWFGFGDNIEPALINNLRIEPDNPEEYDDILKLSNARDVTVDNCYIAGGKEDAVDMNRGCRNVLIKNCEVFSGKEYAFTIKGGSKYITLQDVVIYPNGNRVDIDLGNWSDQSRERTTHVTLIRVTRSDGKPVRVRVGNAERPHVVGCKVDILETESVLLDCYLFFKRLFLKFA